MNLPQKLLFTLMGCWVLFDIIVPEVPHSDGRVKYAAQYPISVHQGAALVIARKKLGFGESFPKYWVNIPGMLNSRLTLEGLVKNSHRPHRLGWKKIHQTLQTVLAEQFKKGVHAKQRAQTEPNIPSNLVTDCLDVVPF